MNWFGNGAVKHMLQRRVVFRLVMFCRAGADGASEASLSRSFVVAVVRMEVELLAMAMMCDLICGVRAALSNF